jgi:AraC family transcriptional regulator of arabinose operon
MDIRVQMVIAHLNNNLHQELRLDSLACSLNISPSRLRHLFKEEVGVSLFVYLKLLRMRRAKELIETTFLSIKEIMFTIGICDESHFVRDFKRSYGLPPMKYRSEYLNSRAKDDCSSVTRSHFGHKIAGTANE